MRWHACYKPIGPPSSTSSPALRREPAESSNRPPNCSGDSSFVLSSSSSLLHAQALCVTLGQTLLPSPPTTPLQSRLCSIHSRITGLDPLDWPTDLGDPLIFAPTQTCQTSDENGSAGGAVYLDPMSKRRREFIYIIFARPCASVR